MKIIELETERLVLRQWLNEDYSAFAKMNADPVVMQYFPKILTREESNTMAVKIENRIAQNGWGFWAVELKGQASFIGFVGLNEPDYSLPVTPCVEIGWRLDKKYWGRGYATEAAEAVLEFSFKKLNLKEVYSFTPVSNSRSRALMERLNMLNTEHNFNHPLIPVNNPLREHVLYKIDKSGWIKGNKMRAEFDMMGQKSVFIS